VSELAEDPAIVDINLTRCPFWQAVDIVAGKANALVVSYDPITLQPLAKDQQPPPVSYSGIFRTLLKRNTFSKNRLTGTSSSTAVLEVAWEPGGRMFYLTQNSDKLEVHDMGGNKLSVPKAAKTDKVTEKSSWEIEVWLPTSPRTDTELALLQGSF